MGKHLGLVRKDNPVPPEKHSRSYLGKCDLIIESLTFANSKNIKGDCHFYRLNAEGEYEDIAKYEDEEIVIRSEVLPGFAFRLQDLKEKKGTFNHLIHHPVYSPYLMKSLQKKEIELGETQIALGETQTELQEKETELQEKEIELQKKRDEIIETQNKVNRLRRQETKGELMAAKLRELGINPDHL